MCLPFREKKEAHSSFYQKSKPTDWLRNQKKNEKVREARFFFACCFCWMILVVHLPFIFVVEVVFLLLLPPHRVLQPPFFFWEQIPWDCCCLQKRPSKVLWYSWKVFSIALRTGCVRLTDSLSTQKEHEGDTRKKERRRRNMKELQEIKKIHWKEDSHLSYCMLPWEADCI